jgi:RNA polymerase sigma factor (sigma-70 family)
VNDPEARNVKTPSWTLTESGFSKFLSWLDNGAESGGNTYLEMRRRLVAYFDRKNCAEPDALADETLNRVARRLEEEGTITSESPAQYCYIVARYVFLESLRSSSTKVVSIDDSASHLAATNDSENEEKKERERLLNCLEQCCDKLEPANRDLILRYYHGKERVKIENRRALAEELGVSMNALSIRTCRIREKLEVCVRKCANNGE